MAIRRWTIRGTAALAVAVLFACSPATDRERYEVGESGVATFHNQLDLPLYLGGCGHFDYEKRVGTAWLSQGPDTVCVWEGLASPVAPGDVVTDAIRAREPGIWRLRYPVGAFCDATSPLSDRHCALLGEAVSNEFEVIETECVVGGCSGQLCVEEEWVSTCEWRPHYACFRAARCGRFGPAGTCAWEPTPELAACLEDQGAPGRLDPIETPR